MFKPKAIGIIGMGKVGRYLTQQFKSLGIIVYSFNRSPKEGALPIEDFPKWKDQLDVVLLCISDSFIQQVSENLSPGNYIIAHVSGTTPMESLSSKHKNRGIFYPLMSLTYSSEVKLKQVPICIEAASEAIKEDLTDLANMVGSKPYMINSSQRKPLHLAAVVSQNFSNHLYQKAYEIMHDAGLPFELLKPLLVQSAERLGKEEPKKYQTGPAVRGDRNTINQHIESLKDQNTKEIYKLITRSIEEYEKEL